MRCSSRACHHAGCIHVSTPAATASAQMLLPHSCARAAPARCCWSHLVRALGIAVPACAPVLDMTRHDCEWASLVVFHVMCFKDELRYVRFLIVLTGFQAVSAARAVWMPPPPAVRELGCPQLSTSWLVCKVSLVQPRGDVCMSFETLPIFHHPQYSSFRHRSVDLQL